jgi:hypothetical protein
MVSSARQSGDDSDIFDPATWMVERTPTSTTWAPANWFSRASKSLPEVSLSCDENRSRASRFVKTDDCAGPL